MNRTSSIFRKTALSALVGALVTPAGVMADPLDLAQAPPGGQAAQMRYPAPDVILSVDNTGSMSSTVDGSRTGTTKMQALKNSLTAVFVTNKTLIPDGSIRLAWQAMWNNNGEPAGPAAFTAAGAKNAMGSLQGTHRTDFNSFISIITASGGTPSQDLFYYVDNYMRTTTGVNSPWAYSPGAQAEPYLGCRRAYHIFLTDGAWNNTGGYRNLSQDMAIGNYDNAKHTFPDSTNYPSSNQTKIYADPTSSTGAQGAGLGPTDLADWAMKSWAERLAPDSMTFTGNLVPPDDYTNAPPTETFGTSNNTAITIDKYWNPRYDPATWPHMVTYTMGYGADGYSWNTSCASPAVTINPPMAMNPFSFDGGFISLINGSVRWPDLWSKNCTDINAPYIRPMDLWHAAINGRGRFYAIKTDNDLLPAFQSIMSKILSVTPTPVATISGIGASSSANIYADVGIYTAGYDPTHNWDGYVRADTFSTSGSTTPAWGGRTTADLLDGLTGVSTRLILTTQDDTNTPVPFQYANLSTAQQALLTADQVNYLRGDRTKEVQNGGTLRNRSSRQGDIINSNVWYIGAPGSSYGGLAGYAAFRQSKASRLPMVYVGGNDGMMHGFSAQDGSEKIAYVPKGVIPNLVQLTQPSYDHRYFVDNTPFTGDVAVSSGNWRTLLVGALGAGGRGYFVLDVTDPASFSTGSVLLDHTFAPTSSPTSTSEDADIGHIFAAPVMHDTNPYETTQITLMNNNRWAAIMGNGVNSVNERPVLLIQYLDGIRELKQIAATGSVAPKSSIDTTANGLSAPRVVDIDGNGTADVVYAGDLKGNLWKFDVSSPSDASWGVAFNGSPLYTATVPGTATRQPITAAPVVRAADSHLDGTTGLLVAFGTGRNVTTGDPSDTTQQTIYSVLDSTHYKIVSNSSFSPPGNTVEVDPGSGTGCAANCVPAPTPLGMGVTAAKLVQQTIATGAGGDTFWSLSSNTVDLSQQNGWYLNLTPSSGERLLKDLSFYDGSNILFIVTDIPSANSGSSSSGNASVQESCDPPPSAAPTAGQEFLTLANIMNGKPPTIALMDRNGDGLYNSADGGVARATLTGLRPSGVRGSQTTVYSDLNPTCASGTGVMCPPPLALRNMPETPVRPSWRQPQ